MFNQCVSMYLVIKGVTNYTGIMKIDAKTGTYLISVNYKKQNNLNKTKRTFFKIV